jgi:hypothetical protein
VALPRVVLLDGDFWCIKDMAVGDRSNKGVSALLARARVATIHSNLSDAHMPHKS